MHCPHAPETSNLLASHLLPSLTFASLLLTFFPATLPTQAVWEPSERVSVDIPHVPTYRPTEEQFGDPLSFIASIRAEAERFGVCRIVPPPSWAPRFSIPNAEGILFPTRIQAIHELQHRQPGGPKVPPRRGRPPRDLSKGRGGGSLGRMGGGPSRMGGGTGRMGGGAPGSAPSSSAPDTPPAIEEEANGGGQRSDSPTDDAPAAASTAGADAASERAAEPGTAPAAADQPAAAVDPGRTAGGASAEAAQPRDAATDPAEEEEPRPAQAPAAPGAERPQAEAASASASAEGEPWNDIESYGFRPGDYHTLESLKKYSAFFKRKYFSHNGRPRDNLTLEDIEGEFWRLVENPDKTKCALFPGSPGWDGVPLAPCLAS